jgi:beta-1,4-N-acetylglucosaminyltransferase
VSSAAGPDPRVLLVCSPGGHLIEMLLLKEAWAGSHHSWVTLAGSDVDCLLEAEEVVLGRGPTNRSLVALLFNFALALRLVRRERPDVIVSTGAALALPFFVVGKLLGARLIYVESVTRTQDLSLTGRLVYPLADAFFVQWPEAARRKRARFEGSLV